MTRFIAVAALCAALFVSTQASAADQCKVVLVAELPIMIKNMQPTIVAKINGRDARFVVDSGAFYSMMSSATAAEYNLKSSPMLYGMRVTGVGGTQDAEVTTVKEFSLVGVPIKNVEFLVAGSEVGSSSVGLLGQNFLEIFDVEYDLGLGAIRLFQTKNCDRALLAYWLTPDQRFSTMPIEPITKLHPHTIGVGYLNGQSIRIAFDTGAGASVLSADAAARAGVKFDSGGVQEVGYSHGIGRGVVKTYIARFDSFKVGDGEEIKNAKLRFAKTDLGFADMLLGADFFISHRIFVGNKEHKLYLSYNGGPVFDLSQHPDASSIADSDPVAANTAAKPAAGDNDTNASEFARRGSALVAQRDFAAGLPLLSKAISLSPNDPEFFYQRANAYWANAQGDLALADFDQVIKLKADFLPAYIPRAELELWKTHEAAAISDLETVDHLAPAQADLRFSLGAIYERVDHFADSIQQYSLWIDSHPDDSRMVSALGSRCFNRAMLNQDPSAAMKDCDKAISRADKKNTNNSRLWVNRALVRIRMGDYVKAIADCNDALKLAPKNANALYMRAVAESKQNKKAESETDLAAARKIAPKVGTWLERHGIGV